MPTVTRKMDQLREGKRGFQARTDLGIPMYSNGRRTAGISRGTGFALEAAAAEAALLAVVAVEVDAAVVEEEVDAAVVAAGVQVVLDDDVGGVELISE